MKIHCCSEGLPFSQPLLSFPGRWLGCGEACGKKERRFQRLHCLLRRSPLRRSDCICLSHSQTVLVILCQSNNTALTLKRTRHHLFQSQICMTTPGNTDQVIPNSVFQYGKSLTKSKVINRGLFQMEWQDCELAEGGEVGVSSLQASGAVCWPPQALGWQEQGICTNGHKTQGHIQRRVTNGY